MKFCRVVIERRDIMKSVKQQTLLLVDLPDYQFIKYCYETFGLNRGVYNAIDEWFFSHNVKSIYDRRKKVLDFLQFYTNQSPLIVRNKHMKLKFGKGNLTRLLKEYMEQQNLLI